MASDVKHTSDKLFFSFTTFSETLKSGKTFFLPPTPQRKAMHGVMNSIDTRLFGISQKALHLSIFVSLQVFYFILWGKVGQKRINWKTQGGFFSRLKPRLT